jgi:hypothetical protein
LPYPPPLTRATLRKLADARVADAQVLLKGRRYAAAYYLCGYGVECAFKACVARTSNRGDFPDLSKVRDSYTHDLSRLVRVAGLESSLAAEEKSDPQFQRYWLAVRVWSEQSRYQSVFGNTPWPLFCHPDLSLDKG